MKSPPFAIEAIDHVVLLVDDMDRAHHFYVNILGCHLDRSLPEYGMIQLRAGTSLIDLVDIGSDAGAWARPAVGGGRNMDHVCLATAHWDESAVRAHLAEAGVAIIKEGIRYGAGGEGLSFYVRDPFGNKIELKRS